MMEYATDEKDRDYWEEHEWSCFKAGKNEAMSEVKKCWRNITLMRVLILKQKAD